MSLAKARRQILSQGMPAKWSKVDDRYGWAVSLRILVPFLAAFIAAPYLVDSSPWWALLIVLVVGVYGYKISFVMHDCSHSSLFSSKALNLWIGRACGWLVGVNYDVFRQTHLLHHRFNGRGLDPQHGEVNGFEKASRNRLLSHIFLPLLGTRAPEVLLGYGGGYLEGTNDEQQTIDRVDSLARETRVMWLLGTAVAQLMLILLVTGFGSILWTAVLYPMAAVTLSLFLARFRTFAEHARPRGDERADFTRSHRPNWIDSLVLYDAHFNYHLEHHLFPQIPSNRLHEIFERFGESYHTRDTLNSSMFQTVAQRIVSAA